MPGLEHILNFLSAAILKLALRHHHPIKFNKYHCDVLKVRNHLNVYASAAELEYGKPHPEVYLNGEELNTSPLPNAFVLKIHFMV